MWPFANTQEKLEPAQPSDPLEEAGRRLREAEAELKRVAAAKLEFQREHHILVDRFERIVSCRILPGEKRPAIDCMWLLRCQGAGRALHAFSACLKEWSEAKMEHEREVERAKRAA